MEPLSNLNNSLNKLFSCNTQFPTVIVAGDFNLPDIMWMDGHGTIKANPAYGTRINSFLLDTLNDHDLEQLLDEPTRNNHFLDLVLLTHSEIICDVTVVPGMSDHEAITFSIKCNISLYKKSSHKVYLFQPNCYKRRYTKVLRVL